MNNRRLSQEALKLIACVCMLIDHFGYEIVPELSIPCVKEVYYLCRIVGRMAFPIYCFLLVEGMHYTRNPYKYILRLALCFFITELPYDYCFEGMIDWNYQNVMSTLTLGAIMVLCMQKLNNHWLKVLIIIPFVLLADLCRGDYGGSGILLIAVFALMEQPVQQLLGVLVVNMLTGNLKISVLNQSFPLQPLAALAMIPISCYSGQKTTRSRAVQWGFYLFYPGHLLLLWAISGLIR